MIPDVSQCRRRAGYVFIVVCQCAGICFGMAAKMAAKLPYNAWLVDAKFLVYFAELVEEDLEHLMVGFARILNALVTKIEFLEGFS